MNTKNLKIVLAALAQKIEEQQKEISLKEYTINSLQRRLKIYEERQDER